MSEFRKVITNPGEVIDYMTVFEENPYLRTKVPTKKGHSERVDYTTDVYEDGNTYHKYCYVYLPHGYDTNDKEKKYNVLYLLHGNTCEPSMFAVGGNKPMIDMLFESGEIDPCIIVMITYYFEPLKYAEERMRSGMIPSGDGAWPAIKANFYREVVESIIPAVETKFNTYLESAADEEMRASRDHRAFSGYSRGAVNTWRIMHHCFEYFRWYCPMSCMTCGDGRVKESMDRNEVIDYITRPILTHPELPFYIFASNGITYDITEMIKQMKYIVQQPCFSFGLDPGKNNLYFALSDYYHTDLLVPYYLWNSLKVLFRGM